MSDYIPGCDIVTNLSSVYIIVFKAVLHNIINDKTFTILRDGGPIR